jgi:hypothetical protein
LLFSEIVLEMSFIQQGFSMLSRINRASKILAMAMIAFVLCEVASVARGMGAVT